MSYHGLGSTYLSCPAGYNYNDTTKSCILDTWDCSTSAGTFGKTDASGACIAVVPVSPGCGPDEKMDPYGGAFCVPTPYGNPCSQGGQDGVIDMAGSCYVAGQVVAVPPKVTPVPVQVTPYVPPKVTPVTPVPVTPKVTPAPPKVVPVYNTASAGIDMKPFLVLGLFMGGILLAGAVANALKKR